MLNFLPVTPIPLFCNLLLISFVEDEFMALSMFVAIGSNLLLLSEISLFCAIIM